ncbi:hypothetical protein ABZY90_06100 [Streptomyces sp. NPDC006422]|uniref:hypothetical protein n=1 Tax=unclassified Streptomyces TaxID=2593676 RepID=UPI0033BD6F58
MLDLIVRMLTWVLGLCTPPPPGRHRLTVPVPAVPAPPPRHTEPLDAAAHALVRPYVLTPEEHRAQRERRRALYLATLGIDTGPRHIHGVRVPVAGGAR